MHRIARLEKAALDQPTHAELKLAFPFSVGCCCLDKCMATIFGSENSIIGRGKALSCYN